MIEVIAHIALPILALLAVASTARFYKEVKHKAGMKILYMRKDLADWILTENQVWTDSIKHVDVTDFETKEQAQATLMALSDELGSYSEAGVKIMKGGLSNYQVWRLLRIARKEFGWNGKAERIRKG